MTDAAPRCYICYGDAGDEPLLKRTCGCRSMDQKFAHGTCVAGYAKTRLDTLHTTYDYLACGTCRVSYTGELARVLLGALDAATAERPPEHPDRLMLKLCYADMFLFNLDDARALEVLQELCEVAERMPLGAAGFKWHINCPVLLATARVNLQQFADAERALAPPLRLLDSADGVPLDRVLWAKRAIAKVHMKLGRQEESERTMRAALAADLLRPHDKRDEASSILLRLDLAEVLEKGRKTQEACHVLEQLVPIARRVFGPRHLVTGDVYMQLSTAYLSLGMSAKTEVLLSGAEIPEKDLHDAEDANTLLLAHMHTVALARLGKYAEALPRLEQLVRAFTCLSGDRSENTLTMQSDRAFALLELGRLEESEALYRWLLAVECEHCGERHATTLCTQGMLAYVLMRAGRCRACALACGFSRAHLHSRHSECDLFCTPPAGLPRPRLCSRACARRKRRTAGMTTRRSL